MQDFKKLDVWHKAHVLVLAIYEATKAMPREETFGLMMQLRRSATFIPMRIAACAGRTAGLEKSADIHKAVASANELEYGVLLARDLGLLGESITQKLTDDTIEVRKMLFGFLKTI